jgi:hypothetical protein
MGSTGARLKGEGLTRDISKRGAYILTRTFPPADTPIRLEIVLAVRDLEYRIIGYGRVLRVEQPLKSQKWGGFAVWSVLEIVAGSSDAN